MGEEQRRDMGLVKENKHPMPNYVYTLIST